MALSIVQMDGFDGPSLWLDRPVVRAIVLGGVAGDVHRLLDICPRLEQLERHVDRTHLVPLSLLPMPESVDAPWLLGWAAVGLQRLTGDNVVYFAARGLGPTGMSEVVIECLHQQTGILALRVAAQQLNGTAADNRERLAEELRRDFAQRLVPVAASRRPTAELACILAAARGRGIPITSVDPRGMIRELGHGVYRRRLLNTTTSNMSFLGSSIARDKQLSLHYLAECGLPVPDTLIARDAEAAVANAQAIGFPVVIKPNDEGNSAGLHLDVRDEEEARSAFEAAARISRSGTVVVQRYLTERHYRVLVVGDRVVGIAERIAAHVVGDGRRSIRELVDIENRNPRRGTQRGARLSTIVIDETTERLLAKQGLALGDVPQVGAQVDLQRIDDLETGGEAIMHTGTVHPDNEVIVLSAVRAMELDMAGVDLIAADISQSIWETSGGILEVNCSTGFNLIQFPTSGEAVDPGPAVIETLFPVGAPVRVPLVAVTGDRETAATGRLIGRMLAAAGYSTGMALDGALYLGETRQRGVDGSGSQGKRRILLNPAVEIAVLEVLPTEIQEDGLAFSACDVAVVTSLSDAVFAGAPLLEGVVCRTLTDAGVIVVPGDDPAAVSFARGLGRSLVLVGEAAELGADAEHLKGRERVVMLRSSGGNSAVEIWQDDGSVTSFSLEWGTPTASLAAVAAIGVLVALELPVDSIERALQRTGMLSSD